MASSGLTRLAAATVGSTRTRAGDKVSLILRKQLDNLGHAGEEVTTAPGYARNFLVPQGLAVYATAPNRARFKVVLSEDAARAKAAERAQNMLTARVGAESVTIKRASTDGKALLGVVTAADVAEALAGSSTLANLRVREANVRIDAPGGVLSTIGTHTIAIESPRLLPGVFMKFKVVIV